MVSFDESIEIVHVQSVLPKSIVDELKHKTHKNSTKEAISTAVYHYLRCNNIQDKRVS